MLSYGLAARSALVLTQRAKLRASNFVACATVSSLSRSHLVVHDKVQKALRNQEPVVALESTIIADGMPYPQNIELAEDVENILRSKGVTPATVAILDGVCRVGLEMEEINDLAKAGGEGRTTKCTTRDIPVALATQSTGNGSHQWGATTVASTMTLAHMAGISTFVTGGIGGVHRNGHVSLDISADLTELSRTPVVVVSAGIKSILDIGRTLEVLETLGVPTVAYGADEFPAFFSPTSGIKAPVRMDDSTTIAKAYWASRELNLSHGMLVAVPNNDPAGENVERAIHKALAKAEAQGILGRDITPFILSEVASETGGDSLRSNMALVRQNAKVGADIASAIAVHGGNAGSRLANKEKQIQSLGTPGSTDEGRQRVLVVGGAVIDLISKPEDGQKLILGTSIPSVVTESDGGVARNVSEVLGLLGSRPALYSAVGNDPMGQSLLSRMHKDDLLVGVEQCIDVVDGARTATYFAVLNELGDLHTAVADMDVFNYIRPPPSEALRHADIVVVDANPPIDVLVRTAKMAVGANSKVFFEPTSVPKAREAARRKDFLSCLSYTFPNVDELMAMADGWNGTDEEHWVAMNDGLETIKAAAANLLTSMHPDEAHIIVTMGANGVLLASKEKQGAGPEFTHFPSESDVQIENCTGAGDSLCGAFIHALLNGQDESNAVRFGIRASILSLQYKDGAISKHLQQLDIEAP